MTSQMFFATLIAKYHAFTINTLYINLNMLLTSTFALTLHFLYLLLIF